MKLQVFFTSITKIKGKKKDRKQEKIDFDLKLKETKKGKYSLTSISINY